MNLDLPTRTSGEEITLPYPKRTDRKRRTILLEINSRDRNRKIYPTASEFRFRLFRSLKDVTQIQIAGGTIPSCVYNVNIGWNSFTIEEDGIRYTATLQPGKYTFQTLANELTSVFNNLVGIQNKYEVSFNTINGKTTIQRIANNKTFKLLFGSGDFVDLYDQGYSLQKINSPAYLLGFLNSDYTSNSNGLIQSPNVADLDFILTRFYLYVNHDNTQDLGIIERAVGRNHPHAILYMDTPNGNYKFLNKETYEPLFQAKPAPIARMATLDIALRDEFDRLIDLNGRDFTLLLEIEYCE
jgi:hypothetical protein